MPGVFRGFLKADVEIGALVGPDSMGEMLVVSNDAGELGMVVSYATTKDIEAAIEHVAAHGPRTVTEASLHALR